MAGRGLISVSGDGGGIDVSMERGSEVGDARREEAEGVAAAESGRSREKSAPSCWSSTGPRSSIALGGCERKIYGVAEDDVVIGIFI
jgi:hypothetical protein